jgi:uroporphyrin-III C-methyltransferase
VIRLKGGDPFVFGRGGEEAQALQEAGIHVEVIPGITAACGIAASAKIPLTHRGVATSVRFVTGHCRAGWWLDLDWPSLAAADTTLVFYMGLAHVREITANLMLAGLAGSTPAAAIAQGTTANERVVRTTLASLAGAAERAELAPPTLFVIGDVVNVLHDGIGAVLREVPRAGRIERMAHA